MSSGTNLDPEAVAPEIAEIPREETNSGPEIEAIEQLPYPQTLFIFGRPVDNGKLVGQYAPSLQKMSEPLKITKEHLRMVGIKAGDFELTAADFDLGKEHFKKVILPMMHEKPVDLVITFGVHATFPFLTKEDTEGRWYSHAAFRFHRRKMKGRLFYIFTLPPLQVIFGDEAVEKNAHFHMKMLGLYLESKPSEE